MQDEVDTTRDYVGNFVNNIIDALPAFLGALAILIVGYIIAKILAAVVRKLLFRANLNQFVETGRGGNVIRRAVPNPTKFVAGLVFWLIFLFAISIAVSVLGIPALVDIVQGIYSYLPNIIAAVLIFLVASALSAGVVTLVTNTMGDTPTGKVVATAAPIIVMVLAVFMILNQLRIAPEIVTITYAALIGSAALGMALAFGLGGREVAGQIWQNLYDASQRNKGSIKADMQAGANNAKRRKDEMKRKR